ncbi:hypothetical protein Rhopal_004374-T1 [Rhodotorula paludigena]|uniref:F-box domain-containing protein n=1 Tax=Rhodotorula paludigena TaxID=86838 RepID=A0AAV5GMB8_9BASI|nr:hypothetical protein Rhopal_004374-T1 [Rhodotorula paludigena]
MAASLSSLPAELLREIVRLVEEQDLEAWKSGVEIAEPPPLYRDDAPVWPVDVVAGRFSSFYERGLQAVSLVNKQLRELALPHLTDQLEHAYFVLKVMKRPQAHLVRHLDLDIDRDELSLYLSLASAIPKLTNLRSVSLDVKFIEVYTSRWYDGLGVSSRLESLLNPGWLQFVDSCTTAFAQITELDVLPRIKTDVLNVLLQRGSFANIQSLVLSDAAALLSNNKHSFCAALVQLRHLDSLELQGVERIRLSHFPSLRHISVDITRRSLMDWSASRLAPSRIPSSVETLDIRFSTQFHLSRFPYHPSDYVDGQCTTRVTLAAPPDLTFFRPDPALTNGFDVFAPRSDAVQNVLEWAQGYFERLRLTRDEAGMEEFAQTLTRVRERQILDSI